MTGQASQRILSSTGVVVVSVSMNKLSKPASDCRISQLVATQVQAAFNILSLAAGHFVRIQTMLRARRKTVKRVWKRKSPLPNKRSIALQSCLQTGQTASLGEARLARLYANGIFARVYRDVLQRNQRAGTSSMTQPTIRLTVNGMIMSTKALLLRSPHASEAELLEALRYNLCRCGAHIEIMRAAMRAAGALAEAQD